MDISKEYKVFISYSWTTPEHEKWVYNLATRLMENGIEVKYDKWDLRPGQDKNAFMESMIQDDSIDRVLIICEHGYKEKADRRAGGVGTETEIITPEIYNKTRQEKFIPIVAEVGESFDSYLPIYLKSRIAIDMSSDSTYEEGYEQLLRLITEVPLYRKPEKGQLPKYLFEAEKSHFKTSNLVRQLKNIVFTRPNQVNYIISEFMDEFKKLIGQFQIRYDELKEPYDEQVYNSIKEMLNLRNDYIEFLSTLFKSNVSFNIDVITKLFEDVYPYTQPQESGPYMECQFDHFKFIIHELFLYTVVILIENEMFKELNIIINSRYFVNSTHTNRCILTIGDFVFEIASLDKYRKSRLKLINISVASELLIQRCTYNNKDYEEELLQADLLLHFISTIRDSEEIWFPVTYIYSRFMRLDIFLRMTSKRHFDKVKVLFGIENKEDMKIIIENYKRPFYGFETSIRGIPEIKNYISSEDLCKYE